ncbi:MAG TPA: type III pantothenate kinase [Anaerolineaceae bacterium]|jgi:type III pantothenate kinase|nr:type III pantothenate kinase [Anaerolineaceae bacterium]
MLLCIDIGNTHIKFGLFDGENLCCQWRIATDRSRLADEYAMLLFSLLEASGLKPSVITGCAISSVVPALTQEFGELSRRLLKLEAMIITPETNSGLHIDIDYPAELGSDLVANAVGARLLYGTPLIIIGYGSATTFTAVTSAGAISGVAIAPGIATGAESLFRATATLPQVALQRPKRAIGKNSIESMQSGLIFGFAALTEGLVKRMQAELDAPARVIATGGLANRIAPETTIFDAVEPDLTLIGIKRIYEINQ